MSGTENEQKKAPLSDFDSSIRYLFETSLNIRNEAYGNSQNTQKLWVTWLTKFINIYTKKKNPDTFIPMFQTFFNENIDQFSLPIFETEEDGSTKVNDNWLKHNEYRDGPGFDASNPPKKIVKNSWTPDDSRCKGYVIYFNDNEKFYMISIPISEIYNTAVKLWRERKEKNLECKTFPAKILLSLFSVVYHSLPDISDQKEILKSNIDKLQAHVDTLTPAGGGSSNVGSGLSGIGKIMSQIMKASGISGSSSFDEGKIDNMIGKIANQNSIEKVGKVIGTVIETIKPEEGSGEQQNIGGVLNKIGKALQSDTVTSAVTEVASLGKPSSESVDLINTIPTAEVAEYPEGESSSISEVGEVCSAAAAQD